MDAVLVVDKPQGVTSHDVVAMARRAIGEHHIGHTGTLDPLATGVLPLACGRATRLVRFLSRSDKTYEAVIRFGLTTDTDDVTGRQTARTDAVPDRARLDEALNTLQGAYLQTPPAHSAKKVGGRHAYDLARRNEAVTLAPVPVEVTALELVSVDGPLVTVRLTCSAGFYVRSFARSLGERTSIGACLEALRRTRTGRLGLDKAVTLDWLAGASRADIEVAAVPLARLLPSMPAVMLTPDACGHVAHGRSVGPAEAASPWPEPLPAWTRLLDGTGALLALAEPTGNGRALHPSVVLI